MRRWIKRLLVFLVIAGGSRAAYRMLRSRGEGSTAPRPDWPPFEPSPTIEPSRTIAPAETAETDVEQAPAAEPETTADSTAPEDPAWLCPVDGECPPGYPIKANDNSHIYHVPGGRFYDRPIAERCYATEEAAQRDGYRRAKS